MNQENILRILDEIEINISKIKNELNSKHELEPKEKYEKYKELINKIKSIDDLKYLFIKNNKCKEHIFKCIGKTNQYPFLNEYINLYFKFNPNKINECNIYRITPLMYSINYNIETSKIILKHTPNLELKDNNNNTALFYACVIKNTNELNNMIKLLLDMGVDYNVIDVDVNETALFNLCRNISANIDTYKMFLDKGVDVNHKNKYNKTILNYFCLLNGNKPEIIDLFKQYGYNFTIHDIDFMLINVNYTYLKQILSYYDNLDLISNVKLGEFDNKPVKLIKILYRLYCNNKIDEEIIQLSISKGAKKEDLIDDKLAKFFNNL